MNDRFKFRIWDKIHNRFLCIDNQKRIIFDYEDKEIRILEDEENACWLHIPFDECIILQCTGLKDKNGKLIYELDYVRYANNKYKVEIDKFFGISLTNILNGDTIVMDDIVLFNCEVIGNEFESNTKI